MRGRLVFRLPCVEVKAASCRRDRRCRLALSNVASDKGLRDCFDTRLTFIIPPSSVASTSRRKNALRIAKKKNKASRGANSQQKRNVYVEKRTTFQGGSDRKFYTATNKNHQQKTRLNIRDWFISPSRGSRVSAEKRCQWHVFSSGVAQSERIGAKLCFVNETTTRRRLGKERKTARSFKEEVAAT